MFKKQLVFALCVVTFTGCASADFGFTKNSEKYGYYHFFGGFSSMGEYEDFLCSKKERKCIDYISRMIGELIESDQILSQSCINGVEILEETMYVDENATTHVQFFCK